MTIIIFMRVLRVWKVYGRCRRPRYEGLYIWGCGGEAPTCFHLCRHDNGNLIATWRYFAGNIFLAMLCWRYFFLEPYIMFYKFEKCNYINRIYKHFEKYKILKYILRIWENLSHIEEFWETYQNICKTL